MNYSEVIRKSLPAFTAARLTPTIGITAVFLLMAHKSPDDLAIFSYVLAAASVLSAFFSLLLATIGKKAAYLAHSPAAQRDVFTGGFTLALIIAAVTYLGCYSSAYFIRSADGLHHLDKDPLQHEALFYFTDIPHVQFIAVSGRGPPSRAGRDLDVALFDQCNHVDDFDANPLQLSI